MLSVSHLWRIAQLVFSKNIYSMLFLYSQGIQLIGKIERKAPNLNMELHIWCASDRLYFGRNIGTLLLSSHAWLLLSNLNLKFCDLSQSSLGGIFGNARYSSSAPGASRDPLHLKEIGISQSASNTPICEQQINVSSMILGYFSGFSGLSSTT